MRIILLFILNAGFNLGLGLAIAAVLGPDGYGRFAIGMTVGVVLATGAFDWLRLSATRFYGETRRDAEPDVRATLNAAYVAVACTLGAALVVALSTGLTFGLGRGMLAAAVLCAVGTGLFDFGTALARARFRDGIYGLIIVTRSVATLALGCGAALLIRDPAVVLVATIAGAILAVGAAARALHDSTARLRLANAARLKSFAVYGLPVVAANVVFQLIVLMNRSAAAGMLGFAEAGRLSLATDIGLRLFLAVGAAVDVFVFQLAVRREAEQGHQAAIAQLRVNAKIVFGVLLLLAVGYAMAMPAFEALLVPARYRGAFAGVSLILLPGLVLFCIGQFALNPFFQMAGRTGPVFGAALTTLMADALGLAVLPRGAGVTGIAAVHSASLALGAASIVALAARNTAVLHRDGDFLRILLAAIVAAAALWPLRGIDPAWLALAAAAMLGPTVFGGTLVLLDVAGLRGSLLERWRRVAPIVHQA